MWTKSKINDLSYEVVGCAIEVHKHLGPGLLESVYEECFIHELKENNISVDSQIPVPIVYKGLSIKNTLKLDLLIESILVVELKSVEIMLPVFKAQLLSYLKLTEKPKGLLINFNCINISKDGLVPLVTEKFQTLPD
jgi:GxxExxY protein